MKTLAAVALLALSAPALADNVPYRESRDILVEGAGLVAEHHHDWRKREASVRLIDARTGKELLKTSSPPLTLLWLSPDGRFLVGFSEIKIGNETQLFVVSRDGSFKQQERITCEDARLAGANCGETVTNFVHWYYAESPDIALVPGTGAPAGVSFNAPLPFECDDVGPGKCALRRVVLKFRR